MLPVWFILLAVTIRLSGGISYIRAVLARKASPNPITWFFWALTPLIAFSAQISSGIGPAAWMTLALAIGPLVIFFLSLRHNLSRAQFTPSTTACAILAALGIALWITTDNPVYAITFSILADIFGSVPTLIKTWNDPASEHARAYLLSIMAMVLTLLTITDWSFVSFGMPLYMLLINLLIFGLTQRRKIAKLFPAARLQASAAAVRSKE